MRKLELFSRNRNLFLRMAGWAMTVLLCTFLSVTNLQAQNVAEISGTQYATLQDALDAAYAATGDVTIDILADFTGFGVVRQKAGQVLTIAGNNKTVNGQIILTNVNGISNTGTTIENLNFSLDLSGYTLQAGTDAVVCVPLCNNSANDFWKPTSATSWWQTHGINIAIFNNYVKNVTVQNCTIDMPTVSSGTSVVAVKAASGNSKIYNLLLDNVTASGGHSFLQLNTGKTTTDTAVIVNNCTYVTNTHNGINLTGGEANSICVIRNSNISSADGYALRVQNGDTKTVLLSNNTFSAPTEGIVLKNNKETNYYISSGTYDSLDNQNTTYNKIHITGGTFHQTAATISQYCEAPYYTAVDNDPSTGWCTVYAVEVAKIGTQTFPTLQMALDTAYTRTGDVTIELLTNITEVAIVHQKAGLNLTIEGNNDTITGQIIIDGDGRASGTETLTIQNVAFYGDRSNFCKNNAGTDSLDAFIQLPSMKASGWYYYNNKYNYAHNITVDNCTFTSTSTSSDLDVVAFKVNSNASGYNISLTNCTGENLHSLAQFTGVTGSNIDNCDLGNTCGSFANVSGGGGAHNFSNNTYTGVNDDDGYAVRMVGTSSATITLTDNDFTAYKALVLGKNGSYNPTGTINVESGEYNGMISKETVAASTAVFSFTGGIFDADSATVASWCAPDYFVFKYSDSPERWIVERGYTFYYDKNATEATGTMDTIIVRQSAPDVERTFEVAVCAFNRTDGYAFAIWNTQPDSTGVSFTPGNNITIDKDTVLYAIWKQGYNVFYDNNGGTGFIVPQLKYPDVDITLSDGTDFSKTDSTLYRWNTAANESGDNYELGGTYSANATATMYAVWRLNLDMTMDSTDVVCYGENNGTDTVKIIGGDAPFQLVLSGAALTENDTVKNLTDRTYIFENLKPGQYNVQLTDVLGKDTIKGTFTIAQPDTLEITAITVPEKPCPLMGTGTYDVSVTAQGGNPGGYHYAWSEAAVDVDADATTVVSGADDRDSTYTVKVIVSDTKNCTAEGSETFTVSLVIADDGTVHSNSKLTIDTIKQGIMTGCDTILREFGTPHFASTNPAITENILDTIFNDIPTNYPDSVFHLGENVVVWTARDTCGHEITGEQIIIIYHYPCPDVEMDGYTYHSVRLVCDCWMSENLRTTQYSDGRPVENIMKYESPTHPNADANAAIYGYLYDWTAALDAASGVTPDADGNVQGICPTGWHMPTDLDFVRVAGNNGEYDISDLRYHGYWLDGGGNNSTDFSLLPGGCYNDNTARYENILGNAYLWSVNSSNPNQPKVFWADCKCYMWQVDETSPNMGCSVRCIKD